jgi:signal peptidase I
MKKPSSWYGKLWYFIWEEDSVLSWIVNIILAYVLIKFLVYPGLGLALNTGFPLVAVVSESMEHDGYPICLQADQNGRCIKYLEGKYGICDKQLDFRESYNLDDYWKLCGSYYENINITKSEFKDFKMRDGFNRGDIIILRGKKANETNIGDIIVYYSYYRPDPIIHRVVKVKNNGSYYFQTKGDHNPSSGGFEQQIPSGLVAGTAWIRLPYLGYVKIWFSEFVGLFI